MEKGDLKTINKALKHEIVSLIEDGSPSDVEIFIPTGCTALDYAITNKRNGGIPVGKITEISGLEGSGKSLMAMHICANAQKDGALAVFIDTENSFVSEFADRIGLKRDESFLHVDATSTEEVFKTIFALMHSLDKIEKEAGKIPYKYIVVVWDSLAATPCDADLETESVNPMSTVSLRPRIISKSLDILIKMAGRKNLAFVILNQLICKIPAPMFGDKFTTPGGNKVRFASTVRIRLQPIGRMKSKKDVIGVETKAQVVKTRFGPNHRQVVFPIYYTHGIDDAESLVETLLDKGFAKSKSGGSKGTMYSMDGVTYYPRREFKLKIRNEPEFRKSVLDEMEKAMTVCMDDPYEIEVEKDRD